MGSLLRSKIVIGIGVVALAALLMIIFGVVPARRENNRKFRTLEDRAEELETAARKGVKNPEWVKEQEGRQDELKGQNKALMQDLKLSDDLLERHFDDPETKEPGPLEFGRWKMVYLRKMDDLTERLYDNVEGISSANPLVRDDPGVKWLEPKQYHPYEKKYWMQEAIVDCLVKANKGVSKSVRVFDGLTLAKKAERFMHPSHKTLFSVMPFEFSVGMKLQAVPEFLKILLDNPLRLEITSVVLGPRVGGVTSAARKGPKRTTPMGPATPPGWGTEMGPMGPEGMAPPDMAMPGPGVVAVEPTAQEKKLLTETLVTVKIRGYVPDYRQPEKKQDGKDTKAADAGAAARSN